MDPCTDRTQSCSNRKIQHFHKNSKFEKFRLWPIMNELLNNLFESILQFITTHFPQTSKNVHFFKLLKTLPGIHIIRDGKGMRILFVIPLFHQVSMSDTRRSYNLLVSTQKFASWKGPRFFPWDSRALLVPNLHLTDQLI